MYLKIEFVIGVVAIISAFITLWMLNNLRTREEDVDVEGIVTRSLKDPIYLRETDLLLFNRTFPDGYSEWTGVSGSSVDSHSVEYPDWRGVSGTVYGADYSNSPSVTVSVVKCSYCKRKNVLSNEFCLGCGAPL